MKNLFRRLWRDEEGRDLVEFALLLALIALVAAVTIQMFGAAIERLFVSASASSSGYTT
jgi:Flp pilus assembly pilin Flp